MENKSIIIEPKETVLIAESRAGLSPKSYINYLQKQEKIPAFHHKDFDENHGTNYWK